jgi:Multiubiquitin
MSDEAASIHKPEPITIQIDRVHHEVDVAEMTGEQLRQLPQPPIGPDRDLFEVVPGHPDRKIEDNMEVELRNGTRFFTAPAHINPGRGGPADHRP